jgi:hypothetical protein
MGFLRAWPGCLAANRAEMILWPGGVREVGVLAHLAARSPALAGPVQQDLIFLHDGGERHRQRGLCAA